MGMSIYGSSAAGPTQGSTVANWQQTQQNFKTMSSAVASGDLTTAQSAYTALTAGSTPPANSPLALLGQAISNGSAGAAQQALQTLHAARGAGHHHHHRTAGASSGTAASTPSDPTSTSSGGSAGSTGGTIGTLLSTVA